MITREEFLKNTNEDELFAVVESFLERAKERSLFNVKNDNCIINGELVLTDTEKGQIIKEILKEFKK